MSNANTLYASFVKAEAAHRARRDREGIVGRHEGAPTRSRLRRRRV